MSRKNVVLDTCVLINLLASGECEDILRGLNNHWLVCAAVEKESLYLRTNDPHNPMEAVTLAPLIAMKLLQLCNIESAEEARLYVNYATQLDDGEAMSVALAISRGYTLATDERKARRLFLEVSSPDRLICTSQIVKDWAEAIAISPERLKSALLQIVSRARFFPPAADSNVQWWSDLCS